MEAGEAGPRKSGPRALVWFCLALPSGDSVLPGMGGRTAQAALYVSPFKHLDKVTDGRQDLAGVRSSGRRPPGNMESGLVAKARARGRGTTGADSPG